jgi:hypothetical protein
MNIVHIKPKEFNGTLKTSCGDMSAAFSETLRVEGRTLATALAQRFTQCVCNVPKEELRMFTRFTRPVA